MNTEKPEQVRVYDGDGYRLRADAFCIQSPSVDKVLLISTKRSNESWTIPGGGLDPNETSEIAAIREAREEAGVSGYLHCKIGSYDDVSRKTRTEVCVIIVTDEHEDWIEGFRQRRWFTSSEAFQHLKKRNSPKLDYFLDACKCFKDFVTPART